ncbi:hypothetical protein SOCEGT47_068300 [Sorangium cellulosum]|uniref:Integral membrane protein n=1 Tax=Sorangium cellulosum TaxID=56 RepID=A0A4P2Q9P6_SORCE|nr:hypothetical protein [Sorangium cellulosum]AUX26269.1 hypothetical protein SOCEGT47_068300 [Sorangium cellulosum]
MSSMSNVTIGYGALLAALGVGGFAATGATHKTALIPAGFGVVAIGLGLLARQERYRMHAMHASALLGLLGVLGSARGLSRLPALLSGGDVERPAAVVAQSLMAGLSAAFVVLCVRSFVAARRAAARP